MDFPWCSPSSLTNDPEFKLDHFDFEMNNILDLAAEASSAIFPDIKQDDLGEFGLDANDPIGLGIDVVDLTKDINMFDLGKFSPMNMNLDLKEEDFNFNIKTEPQDYPNEWDTILNSGSDPNTGISGSIDPMFLQNVVIKEEPIDEIPDILPPIPSQNSGYISSEHKYCSLQQPIVDQKKPLKRIVINSEDPRNVIRDMIRSGKRVVIKRVGTSPPKGARRIKVSVRDIEKIGQAFGVDLLNPDDATVRPETPQSLVESDEERMFSAPYNKVTVKKVVPLKSFLATEDDCFRCLPPAQVTGQMQYSSSSSFVMSPAASVKSETQKSSPESSPKASLLESSMSMEMLLNKNTVSVDHDYGFSCRSKLRSKMSPGFSMENLGIQTPSASEPPTDSDDDWLGGPEYSEKMTPKKTPNYRLSLGRSIISDSTKESGKKRYKKRKYSTMLEESPEAEVEFDDIKSGAKRGRNSRTFTATERFLHNTNEQVRRIEMRQSFDDLKSLIPNLSDKQRAPKVMILQEAKMYCDDLCYEDLKLQSQVASLRQRQNQLRSVLTQLRKMAAVNRF